MLKLLRSFHYCLFFLLSFQALSQVNITSPQDRVVYQRNNNNEHQVAISGYTVSCVDKIEFRLIPLKSSSAGVPLGTAIPASGWTELISNAICGNFSANVTVTGGWYQLEIRTVKNNNVIATNQVDHVGIGEVFVVAGQSNATGGDANVSGPGASQDAVSSVNFQNNPVLKYSDVKLPCPEYVHLDQNTKTAPFGNYAWCWGSFGDLMVEKLGVPVMIFNTGWSSTGLWNWKESIDYQSPTPTMSPFGYTFPDGLPFGHLRLALNNYISQLGVRAILWHQGESDNITERTKTAYYDDLKTVIEESRALSDKPDLAWLVSRATRFTINGTSRIWQPVIDAQNAISGLGTPAEKVPYVFPGPDTDPYFNTDYRIDEIHFAGNGLQFLAQLWADQLDPTFFQNSVPYVSQPGPTISETMVGNQATFTASAGYTKYEWLAENNCETIVANTVSFSPSPGLFRLKSTDANNNTVYSPYLFASSTPLPVRLASFQGQAAAEQLVNLTWTTASEINVNRFEIQRGKSPSAFESIGTLDSKGSEETYSKYYYSDKPNWSGQAYYRLKIIDNDATYSYSRIISTEINNRHKLSISPNPVSEILHITTERNLGEIVIYNMQGVKFLEGNYDQNNIELNIKSFPKGLYILKSKNGSEKFLKL